MYKSILGKAWQTTWNSRFFWPVAAIASLSGMGANLNVALHRAGNTAMNNLDALPFGGFIGNTSLATRLNLSGGLMIGVAGLLATMAIALGIVMAQHLILKVIQRGVANKTEHSWKEIGKELRHPHVFRILVIDLLFWLSTTNLFLLGGALIRNSGHFLPVFDLIFGIIFVLSLFIVGLGITVVGMLALIGVVEHDLSVDKAIAHAVHLFVKHPGICLEWSGIMFAVVMLGTIIWGAINVLLLPLFIPFLGVAIAAQSGVFLILTILLAAVLILTVTVAAMGALTSFTTAAWQIIASELENSKKVKAHFLPF